MIYTNSTTVGQVTFSAANSRGKSICSPLMLQKLLAGAPGSLNVDANHVRCTVVLLLTVPHQYGEVMMETFGTERDHRVLFQYFIDASPSEREMVLLA
jgi:hypothetical protein